MKCRLCFMTSACQSLLFISLVKIAEQALLCHFCMITALSIWKVHNRKFYLHVFCGFKVFISYWNESTTLNSRKQIDKFIFIRLDVDLKRGEMKLSSFTATFTTYSNLHLTLAFLFCISETSERKLNKSQWKKLPEDMKHTLQSLHIRNGVQLSPLFSSPLIKTRYRWTLSLLKAECSHF